MKYLDKLCWGLALFIFMALNGEGLVQNVCYLPKAFKNITAHVKYLYVKEKYPSWISEWYRP